MYALTTHQLQVERRESHRANQVYALTTHQLQVERRESHRDNQVYALTTHQLQVERRESHRDNQVYALTTHQLQVERRERHRANQIIYLKQICYVTAIISVLSVKTKSIEAQEAKLNRTLHSTSCTHDMTVPPPFWKLWGGGGYFKNYGNQNLVKIKLYNSIN